MAAITPLLIDMGIDALAIGGLSFSGFVAVFALRHLRRAIYGKR